ncbi:MAG: amino acid adenylation domain-containing protein [Lachnospiraceae bacterium]|jgi:amino acid adenylation domain-containing protein|nr:amino acid adenylation domain-containing protein [Lachnospiraceae bacterium]
MRTTVLSYLEDSAVKYSDKVAFFDNDNNITFSELRNVATHLGFFIKSQLLGKRNPVLVYLPKDITSIIAFMGILYSGNFYTPTDIRFPAEKVISVMKALKPKAVVVNNKTKEKFLKFVNEWDVKLINIDEIELNKDLYVDSKPLIDNILDVDPVYVFFTSGSTGVPKGVIINNHNVIDYTDWAVEHLPISEKSIMGSQSPFYFDISTQDIYSTLKTGATLGIIPPQYFAFPAKVLQFIKERHINFLYWVPSAFVNIANFDLLKSIRLDEVELIMFGGEVMPVKQLNYWKKYLPNLKTIANVYGPTEATVNCTYYIVNREFSDSDTLPLGKACENTGLLVLDEDGIEVHKSDVGKQGELCVYGSSLSAGYWNDEEKTNEKYINNPLSKYYKEKMYLTGDIVCYNDLGELVFVGRKDFQIKHSGYRIELGEIEAAAIGNEKISNVCSSYDSKNKKIVLFYQGDIDDNELKDYLLEIIPKYMVPTVYYKLDRFPYNDNGKIDRKKLNEEYIQNK